VNSNRLEMSYAFLKVLLIMLVYLKHRGCEGEALVL